MYLENEGLTYWIKNLLSFVSATYFYFMFLGSTFSLFKGERLPSIFPFSFGLKDTKNQQRYFHLYIISNSNSLFSLIFIHWCTLITLWSCALWSLRAGAAQGGLVPLVLAPLHPLRLVPLQGVVAVCAWKLGCWCLGAGAAALGSLGGAAAGLHLVASCSWKEWPPT